MITAASSIAAAVIELQEEEIRRGRMPSCVCLWDTHTTNLLNAAGAVASICTFRQALDIGNAEGAHAQIAWLACLGVTCLAGDELIAEPLRVELAEIAAGWAYSATMLRLHFPHLPQHINEVARKNVDAQLLGWFEKNPTLKPMPREF